MTLISSTIARPVLGGEPSFAAEVLRRDPWAGCMVAARYADENTLTPWPGQDPGRMWSVDGGRQGLCFVGGNLVPISGDRRALTTFAGMLARRGRSVASVLGRAELVLPLWSQLEESWGPARLIRPDQPLLVCPDAPAVPVDPQVRYAQQEDLDRYFDAAVHMFRDELEVDPRAGDGGRAYRRRISDLVSAGRCFVRYEGSDIVFKAELGAVSERAAMIQGVWVHPDRRGSGIGTGGMAAVVAAVQQGLGRTPVLYVNAFNTAARRVYRRVGFHQVGTFASVLF